jgi:hypothetical protein
VIASRWPTNDAEETRTKKPADEERILRLLLNFGFPAGNSTQVTSSIRKSEASTISDLA